MRYAIIKNGIVENVIVADQDFIDTNYPDAVALKEDERVGPQYLYDGKTFTEPEWVWEEPIDAEIVEPIPAIEN